MNIEEMRDAFQAISWPVWVMVPVISFLGVIIGVITGSLVFGMAGCAVGSVVVAGIAYLKPRRDIVALLAPMYALIIFNPFGDFPNNLTLQVLFAVTITAVIIRVEKRFSTPPENPN